MNLNFAAEYVEEVFMPKAQIGNIVRVHYVGTLDDGSQFDSSKGGNPLEFAIGGESLLKKFEEAVIGLEPGETTSVKIPAAEGYGERKDELVVKFDKSKIPSNINPEVGMVLQSRTSNGSPVALRVIEVMDDSILIDANHELAGKNLNFNIELVEILQ